MVGQAPPYRLKRFLGKAEQVHIRHQLVLCRSSIDGLLFFARLSPRARSTTPSVALRAKYEGDKPPVQAWGLNKNPAINYGAKYNHWQGQWSEGRRKHSWNSHTTAQIHGLNRKEILSSLVDLIGGASPTLQRFNRWGKPHPTKLDSRSFDSFNKTPPFAILLRRRLRRNQLRRAGRTGNSR